MVCSAVLSMIFSFSIHLSNILIYIVSFVLKMCFVSSALSGFQLKLALAFLFGIMSNSDFLCLT